MSDAVLLGIIASIPPTVAAMAAWRRAERARRQSEKNGQELQVVKVEFDGKFREFIRSQTELAKSLGFKEGMAEGISAANKQRRRKADREGC